MDFVLSYPLNAVWRNSSGISKRPDVYPFVQSWCHVQISKSGPLKEHNADDYDSHMGVIEGRYVMGLGRTPRTGESHKWRSTFTKTQVPQMGTNAAVGDCGTQTRSH